MKKVILMMAFAIGMTGAYAQKTVKVEKTGNDTEETTDSGETETMPLPDKEDARRSPSTEKLEFPASELAFLNVETLPGP